MEVIGDLDLYIYFDYCQRNLFCLSYKSIRKSLVQVVNVLHLKFMKWMTWACYHICSLVYTDFINRVVECKRGIINLISFRRRYISHNSICITVYRIFFACNSFSHFALKNILLWSGPYSYDEENIIFRVSDGFERILVHFIFSLSLYVSSLPDNDFESQNNFKNEN